MAGWREKGRKGRKEVREGGREEERKRGVREGGCYNGECVCRMIMRERGMRERKEKEEEGGVCSAA
jgi:hypothetical protein